MFYSDIQKDNDDDLIKIDLDYEDVNMDEDDSDIKKEIFNPTKKDYKDSERYKASLSKEIYKFDITTKMDIYEDATYVTKNLEDISDKKKGRGKKDRNNIERVLDNRDKEMEEKENRERQLAEIEKARDLQEQKDNATLEVIDTWVPNY